MPVRWDPKVYPKTTVELYEIIINYIVNMSIGAQNVVNKLDVIETREVDDPNLPPLNPGEKYVEEEVIGHGTLLYPRFTYNGTEYYATFHIVYVNESEIEIVNMETRSLVTTIRLENGLWNVPPLGSITKSMAVDASKILKRILK